VFSPQDIAIIEEWQPKDRINLSFNYSLERLTAVLAFNRYGEYTVCEGSCDSSSNRQTFGAKILTDINLSYRLQDDLTFNFGGNNIFDETPDKNVIGQSRAGTIADASGNVFVSSPGVFQYSRRSAPFGFNGAYFFAGVTYDF
jgi:iron complex outermembrane receptor protein